MGQLNRITRQPGMMGEACIRGMGVKIGLIFGQIGVVHSIDELLGDYCCLEREDVLRAICCAAWLAEEREVMLSSA